VFAKPAYNVPFSATGTFAASLFARYNYSVPFSAVGTMAASVTPIVPAPFGAVGTFSAGMIPGQAIFPNFSASGAMAANVSPVVPSAFLGLGTMAATVQPVVPPAFGGAGTMSALVAQAMGNLTDDFQTQDTVKWNWSSAKCSITPEQRLQIIPGTGVNEYIGSALNYSLIGQQVEVCMFQVPEQGGGTLGQTLSLLGAFDSNGYGWSMWEANNTLVLRYNGSAGLNDASVAFNATNHKFWRIRESGGNIFYDTAPDGVTWTNQRTLAVNPEVNINALQAQLLGYWTGSGSPGVAIFDNFNLPILTKFITASFSASGSMSGLTFVPFTETNTARTNQAVPANIPSSGGAYVTLIGAGGGGGRGGGGTFSNECGGGGGGGAAIIPRVLVPISSLGATYSVTVPSATAQQTAGASAVFSSGSVSMTAGGGGRGADGTTTVQGAAGSGGTATISGVSATNIPGGAGGIGGFNSGPAPPAAANQTTACPGGGGGGGRSSLGTAYASGKGGNSNFATGGASSSGSGAAGGSGGTGNPGGGGAGGAGGNGNSYTGGSGGTYGAGGGGSGGDNSGAAGNAGGGAAGYTLIEWVPGVVVPPLQVYFDSLGTGVLGNNTNGLSSWSYNHAIGSAAQAILIGVSFSANTSSGPAISVTVGGVAATLLAQIPVYSAYYTAYGTLQLWGLLNPPTGNQTIAITSSITGFLAANSVAYRKVSTFRAAATNTGGTVTSVSVTETSAATDMTVAIFQHMAGSMTQGQGSGWGSWTGNGRVNVPFSSYYYPSLLMADQPGAAPNVTSTASIAGGTSAGMAAIAVDLIVSAS
jgi:hypothetical protein